MTASGLIELQAFDLALASAMVFFSMLLSWVAQSGIERDFMFGAVRSAVQLIFVGYLLQYIFHLSNPILVFAMLIVMVVVAAWAAAGRQNALGKGQAMKVRISLAVAIGSASFVTLAFVMALVVRPDPLWHPRYVIPLAGMVISYAMNSSALAFDRFAGEIDSGRGRVETAIALGANPSEATAREMRTALRASAIPLINYFATVGIVQLPGMMTGQILAGESPVTAIGYQILVSYMLSPAMMIGSFVSLIAARRLIFDSRGRLIY